MKCLVCFCLILLVLNAEAQWYRRWHVSNKSDCIGCPNEYPHRGEVIITDTIHDVPALTVSIYGREIKCVVDAEIPYTLISLDSIASIMKLYSMPVSVVHLKEKDTITLPVLKFKDYELGPVRAIVMKFDSTALILGPNAFEKIGDVAMNKYFPPFQMVLWKHGNVQKPLFVNDTVPKGKYKLELFAKGVYLYKSQLFAYALPYFKLYFWSHPDSVYGYLWTARVYNIKSQPAVNIDAVKYYKQAWNILVKDSARPSYKQMIIEIAGYLSAYEYLSNFNLANAIWYLKQAYLINPTSTKLSDGIKRLENLGATGQKASFKHEEFRSESF